jgi:DNA-directed RNA polymerase specialized sigma24 family protein
VPATYQKWTASGKRQADKLRPNLAIAQYATGSQDQFNVPRTLAAASVSQSAMSAVTHILSQIEQGDPQAAEKLLPLVYDELRKLAAAKLAHEKPGQTLQATALVHEAWLRLVGGGRSEVRSQKSEEQAPTSDHRPPASDRWNSRGHFFGAAAEAMRRILVENARCKLTGKRGGQLKRVNLEQSLNLTDEPLDELLALDEALASLRREDPIKADLVQLRYFAGLTVPQAAEALGISRATAYSYWNYAKAWLFAEISDKSPEKID